MAETLFNHSRTPNETTEFKELTKRDAQSQLAHELSKLLLTAPAHQRQQTEHMFQGFQKLFLKFLQDIGPSVEWQKIETLPGDAVKNYSDLKEPSEDVLNEMLNKLVVIKLNGGLGTSMGCTGPKSVIPVRSDLTFLDLTVQQIEHLNKTYNVDVPLVLMNSFNTEEDTQKVLKKYRGFNVKIYTFEQNKYPRINRESMLPVATSVENSDPEAWYPPGHGDFYESFHKSGLLQQFIDQGKEVCFVSNIDNLGATVDVNILNTMLNHSSDPHPEFIMEVTDKTIADVKGGTLIQYEGKLRLLEIAQVPKEHVDEFKSVKTFKIFNTNNLWMSLRSIASLVQEGMLDMEIIVNHKHLDYGINVIQLETASGAAMKDFARAIGINVPRKRFLPVKKTSDLLAVMSSLYLMKNGTLEMSPKRAFPTVPLVKLGENHFAKVRDFLRRFASIPDMLELDHLTVSGDVTFGKGVSLRGTVIIIANHGDRIDIPAGAILENKIVSGNLRILDH
ncbi:UTP--glucose-1-phosphate uridylyltransferase-like [Limulus polyphemus]|uniref:UTP--glucose-1-phosphate uridylyltransferase n=1 Tax=Limulus polyphemus TaxID=6850 RepID=A0ABM1T9A0_LIMPO|nr:UTP--glucose-1-phosphate uridylyltransferase-like [Limulus polyphemus]XP_022252456.1 UTP--glucose-1-phosphate uridylyltransferase-like [Limulus polyphemus]